MELQAPNNDGESAKPDHKPDSLCPSNGEHQRETLEPQPAFEEIDSTCSTPYVSAPSSPGRASGSGLINGGFFYSAPASPMHFAMTSVSLSSPSESLSLDNSVSLGFEFEFSARFGSSGSGIPGSMSSADELFLDGKIRPMKLSTHLERPQVLAPLPDLEHEDEGENGDKNERRLSDNFSRGRDLRLRDKSLRRRTRSLSPLRNMSFQWTEDDGMDDDDDKDRNESSRMDNKNDESKNEGVLSGETTPSVSGSSSRSSSAGRSSKRWVFLKDFLYRSKSEGRSNSKFWSTISFTPGKEKKPMNAIGTNMQDSVPKERISNLASGNGVMGKGNGLGKKPVNGVGKRRVPPSPHELHYTANRAQAEEMRKKTFLPYRQGLLGCLGFSSKGYGAMNGFARALNPVSSR